jgi:serine/threonine protein kinase
MALSTGMRHGSYDILSAIGAGGMGEVYRARDTSLKRDVALKMPESFATDFERLARFQREAEVLASLNHPNIAAIYGLEYANGVKALVMELVEGEDLAERIARGPIPLDEALPIARQIAEALEAAHEHGIIHRDLKPANIKVRPDGTVKVLDFGLAKAFDSAPASIDASQSATMTSPAMTRMGVILGTAAYMSPEQARGKPVNKRADIWSFGVVLYEMVTGRQLFKGSTVSDTLAALLTKDPEWERVPQKIRPLLRRCLEKDPKRRWHDIADAWLVFDEKAESAPARTNKTVSILAALLAVGVISLAVSLWRVTRTTDRGPQPVIRLDLDLGSDGLLGSSIGPRAILSPDGARLVIVAQGVDGIRSPLDPAARPGWSDQIDGLGRSVRSLLLPRRSMGRVLCGRKAEENFSGRRGAGLVVRRPGRPRGHVGRGWQHHRGTRLASRAIASPGGWGERDLSNAGTVRRKQPSLAADSARG